MEVKIRIAKKEDAAALLEIYSYFVKNTAVSFEYEIPSLKENLRQNLNLTAFPSVIIRLGYGEEPKTFAPREEVKF